MAGALTGALAGIAVLLRGPHAPSVNLTDMEAAAPEVTAAGTAGPSVNASGGSATIPPPRGSVRLGPASRLAPGMAESYVDPATHTPDVVIRLADGSLSALSAVCTHAGCTVQYDASGGTPQLVCPCHGSRFSASDGAVLQGPASEPLPMREVVEYAGSLYAVPTGA